MPALRFAQPYNLNTRMPFSDPNRTNLRVISHVMQDEPLTLQTTLDDTYQARFFDYAAGSTLDHWGVVLELPRLPAELDAAYRVRLKTKFQTRGNAKTPTSIDTALDDYGATVTPVTTCAEIGEWYQFVSDHDVYRWEYNPKDTSDLGYLTYSALMSRIPTEAEATAEAIILRNLQPAHCYGAIGCLRPPTIDTTAPATVCASKSDDGAHLPAQAIDNVVTLTNGVLSANADVTDWWWQADYGAGVLKKIVRVRILNPQDLANPTRQMKRIRIEASLDGVTFTKIPIVRYLDNCVVYNTDEATLTQVASLGSWADMIVDPEEYHYRFWRVFAYDNWGDVNNIGFKEIEFIADTETDPMYIKQYAHAYNTVGGEKWMWADNFYRDVYPAGITDCYQVVAGGAIWTVKNGALQCVAGAAAAAQILLKTYVAPSYGKPAVSQLEDVLVDSVLQINDKGAGWMGFCLRYDSVSGQYYAVGFDTNGASNYFVYYYDGAALNLLTSGAVGVDMNAAGGQRVQIWLERNRLSLKVAGAVILNGFECEGLHTIRGQYGFIKYDQRVDGLYDSAFFK